MKKKFLKNPVVIKKDHPLALELDEIDARTNEDIRKALEPAAPHFGTAGMLKHRGMWQKGKAIVNFRSIRDQNNPKPASFYKLEQMTGIRHQILSHWNDIVVEYPNINDYLEASKPKVLAWVKNLFGKQKLIEHNPQPESAAKSYIIEGTSADALNAAMNDIIEDAILKAGGGGAGSHWTKTKITIKFIREGENENDDETDQS